MSLVSVVSAKSCSELKRVAVRPFVGRDALPPCRPAPLGAWDGVRQSASRLTRSADLARLVRLIEFDQIAGWVEHHRLVPEALHVFALIHRDAALS